MKGKKASSDLNRLLRLQGLLAAYFKKRRGVKLAAVFGSYATGKQGPKSDLDVAIAGRRLFTSVEKINIRNELSILCGLEVDLLDLRGVSGVILGEALRHGKWIKKADTDLLAQIIKKHLFDDADFMPLYDRIVRGKLKRFIHS